MCRWLMQNFFAYFRRLNITVKYITFLQLPSVTAFQKKSYTTRSSFIQMLIVSKQCEKFYIKSFCTIRLVVLVKKVYVFLYYTYAADKAKTKKNLLLKTGSSTIIN